MNKKLIQKMIQNCFKQYDPHAETLPIGPVEMEKLCRKILTKIAEDPKIELYELINDTVYEYIAE